MAATDDLPWPELGNVSRGATRGNQGQKGVLGPADREGRCILQLRVQPGVLAVRLNRQASDWYRTLDGEVNRALKLTKTYWRKARRRQDYDARADQDHMELHEWLQQLKDKTMSQLELLMQKGDIQGPPYAMPEDIELSFLRKFIERQATGIPHNPRLRNSLGENSFALRGNSVGSITPEPSDHGFADQKPRRAAADNVSDGSSTHIVQSSRTSGSPTLHNPDTLAQEASSSKHALQVARASLSRAQKDTQDAFLRYNTCLDTEQQARQAVSTAEKRRDDIMSALISRSQPTTGPQSRHSSVSADERRSPSRYHPEGLRTSSDSMKIPRPNTKAMDWPEADGRGVYPGEVVTHREDHSVKSNRKHSRNWDRSEQLQDGPYICEDITTLPPRKRVHHMMPGFDVLNHVALPPHNVALQS